jgi:hypothetical protein
MRRTCLQALFPLLAFGFLAAGLHAGEEHPEGPHLRYAPSYAEAMLEARIRGVPIFFTRHKDF